VLLALSIVLIFVATLDQVNLGIWAVQEKYFRSFFVIWMIPGTQVPLPLFPGGYLVGGLLLVNMVATHADRLCFTWRKAGLILAHAGIVMLLVGELITGILQEDYQMQLTQGETRNYSESQRTNELVVIDTSNPEWDDVVAIPESFLSQGRVIQHPRLPFRVLVKDYYPNSLLQTKRDAPNAPASPATSGLGTQMHATPLPLTTRQDERNMPASFVEIAGPDASAGTFLVSPQIEMAQPFAYAGHTYTISMRFTRRYLPFSLTLMELRHDIYPGSDIPRNFSSRVKLRSQDGKEDRDVLIYMNNPLRHGGLTFYQYQMNEADRYSVLQAVSNPGWFFPYVSCVMLGLGLTVHFGVSLAHFFGQRGKRTP
jgi:hypothetical protein